MTLKIRVRRKCDGAVGTVKSARGRYEGLEWVTVVYDKGHLTTKNANLGHFEILSMEYS